ncbi:MAG: diphthine--ammonia ligase [Spirochaetes bacterium]|nr:diphthine--ammonia ligase [Spirochaetota bacterium]
MNIISSWSGGKDSALACYRAMKEGHDVGCLLNFISSEYRRCCFHGIEASLMADQAGCIGIPIVQKETTADMKEYEREFKEAIGDLKSKGYGGMVFGDVYLDEHREWVERVCSEMDVVAIEPLWNSEPGRVIEEFIDEGFSAVIVSCKEELGKDFVGREIDREVLRELKNRGICPCGENGEYHTLVLDGPIFSRRIIVSEAVPILKDGFWPHWFLDIKDYTIELK